jgi:membrane protein DedA with SNARE-associated domain
MIGSSSNYLIGRYLGTTNYIQKKLAHPKVKRVEQYLDDRGLFIFMVTGRCITFTRPIYAVLLGSLKIPPRRFFLYESIIAFVWVSFWLFVIIRGEALYFRFFN